MSGDTLKDAIDRLEKTISDLRGTIVELVGDVETIRMKQAMLSDRVRKISIRVKDYHQDQHGPSIPVQDPPAQPAGIREVQRRLEDAFPVSSRLPMEMPTCTTCKHVVLKAFDFYRCGNPSLSPTDPVSGALRRITCSEARTPSGICGPNGRGWEKKR